MSSAPSAPTERLAAHQRTVGYEYASSRAKRRARSRPKASDSLPSRSKWLSQFLGPSGIRTSCSRSFRGLGGVIFRPSIDIVVERDNVLSATSHVLLSRLVSENLVRFRTGRLNVSYLGEGTGVEVSADFGGPCKELFDSFTDELIERKYIIGGQAVSKGAGAARDDAFQSYVFPYMDPSTPRSTEEHSCLSALRAAGRLYAMGLCWFLIYQDETLCKMRLAPSAAKYLVGRGDITVKDAYAVDPPVLSTVSTIQKSVAQYGADALDGIEFEVTVLGVGGKPHSIPFATAASTIPRPPLPPTPEPPRRSLLAKLVGHGSSTSASAMAASILPGGPTAPLTPPQPAPLSPPPPAHIVASSSAQSRNREGRGSVSGAAASRGAATGGRPPPLLVNQNSAASVSPSAGVRTPPAGSRTFPASRTPPATGSPPMLAEYQSGAGVAQTPPARLGASHPSPVLTGSAMPAHPSSRPRSQTDGASRSAASGRRGSSMSAPVGINKRLTGQVTPNTVGEYASGILAARATNCAEISLKAFAMGFWDVVPLSALSVLTPEELAQLLFGRSTVDVADIKATAQFNGHKADSHIAGWLWRWLEAASEQKKRLFIRFVTGTETVPPGGFKSMRWPITIDMPHDLTVYGKDLIQKRLVKHVGPAAAAQHTRFDASHLPFQVVSVAGVLVPVDDMSLYMKKVETLWPSASTCTNQLHMPPYQSEAKFKEQLEKALEHGGSGFGML